MQFLLALGWRYELVEMTQSNYFLKQVTRTRKSIISYKSIFIRLTSSLS